MQTMDDHDKRLRRLTRGLIGSAVAIGVVLAGTGCAERQGNLADAVAPNGGELPIQAERADVYSSYARPLRLAVYDQASLARLGLTGLPVDFREQMVLLAAMGPSSSDDCRIRIDRVWRDGQQVRVAVTNTYPSEGALRRPGAASPYHAVVVPRWEQKIEGFTSRIPREATSRKVLRGS